MKSATIIKKLRDKDYTLTKLANEMGVSRQYVSQVVTQRSTGTGYRIRERIANITGIRQDRLWRDRAKRIQERV